MIPVRSSLCELCKYNVHFHTQKVDNVLQIVHCSYQIIISVALGSYTILLIRVTVRAVAYPNQVSTEYPMHYSETEGLSWFAIQTKSSREKFVAEILRGKGYEEFVPLYRSRRKWSDRFKELDLPLFPGYVFCRFDPGRRLPVLTTPGVLMIVGHGRTPVPILDSEIEALRTVVRSKLQTQPWPYLKAGQRVRIEGSVLTGLEGILLEMKNACRLIVSVNLLHRSVAVEVDRNWVRPIEHSPEELLRASPEFG